MGVAAAGPDGSSGLRWRTPSTLKRFRKANNTVRAILHLVWVPSLKQQSKLVKLVRLVKQLPFTAEKHNKRKGNRNGNRNKNGYRNKYVRTWVWAMIGPASGAAVQQASAA